MCSIAMDAGKRLSKRERKLKGRLTIGKNAILSSQPLESISTVAFTQALFLSFVIMHIDSEIPQRLIVRDLQRNSNSWLIDLMLSKSTIATPAILSCLYISNHTKTVRTLSWSFLSLFPVSMLLAFSSVVFFLCCEIFFLAFSWRITCRRRCRSAKALAAKAPVSARQARCRKAPVWASRVHCRHWHWPHARRS